MKKPKEIIVIGAGIAGLATASMLAARGHKVTVLEKNNFLGGRASVYTENGFTFDKGPSWYMMPEVFEDYFANFGAKASDFYDLRRLECNYKVFFDDETVYKITQNSSQNEKTFEGVEKGAGQNLHEYLAQSARKYNLAMKHLVKLDYTSYIQVFNINLIKNFFALGLFTDLHTYVKKFFKSEKLQKIIEFTTVFLGGSPFNTPAFYSLIAHTDFNLGVYYPMGGINRVIEAQSTLCKKYGVKIVDNSPVTKISTHGNFATQVCTATNCYTADIVVSAADYHFTETELLRSDSQTYSQKYWDKKTPSPSAFIIYLGLNAKVQNIEHHNLYFADGWENHFKDVFGTANWPQKPPYYVHAPSKTDPTVAPSGGETLMILVPVATNLIDSPQAKEKFADQIVAHFEKLIGQKITGSIAVKKIYSQQNFVSEYNSFKGSAFGLAHTLMQTAIFRPKNKSAKVKNLYYVGQHTNPGVGMPPALISAQIVCNLIKKEYEQ